MDLSEVVKLKSYSREVEKEAIASTIKEIKFMRIK